MAIKGDRYIIDSLIKLAELYSDEISQLNGESEKNKAASEKRREALNKIKAQAEFHTTASQLGCLHPEILFKTLEDSMNIEEANGQFIIKPVDKTNGMPLLSPLTGRSYTLQGFISKMAQGEEFGMLFPVDGGGESTNKGAATKSILNPWKKETFNLTQQGKIFMENPSLAHRLMAEAKQ